MAKRVRKPGKSLFFRLLDRVEAIGNALPHPATLFALLALGVILLSAVATAAGVGATHPGTGERIEVRSLLSGDGIRWLFENVVENFVRFPPLGLVLVAMVGIGVAEGSGLLAVLIRALVIKAPRRLITAAVVLAGIVSHVASEAGYVILIPLGAAIFLALGRHPLAGLAAAFAGVSAGFGANFLIASIDPVLAGLSESAARLLDPAITISPAVNLYFMVASGCLLVVAGTWVTERIVEPRLGRYTGTEVAPPMAELTAVERRGLVAAGITLAATTLLFLLAVVPSWGILRTPGESVLHSAFFRGLITAILFFFLAPGLAYGIATGSIRSDKDVVRQMTAAMGSLASYIVLVFFAAQFVYSFGYSNLGLVLAVRGAELLEGIGLTGVPLMIGFVLMSAFINLFMGSASAKWAIMAPVFVPMFMLLGYHPGLTQAVFRIGDSVTNVVTPMMSYFALIVAFAQKYDPRSGLGTLISTMLPYTLLFGLLWTLLLVGWMLLGLPVGPDGPLQYVAGS
ncbi:MAG: AbgT family transporter [Thermoanaerobaculia bacterium]|nr:AbgT family transporter [Thermoanaerobaculia bacterium]MDI9629854.1 AbgT family transporter [Acidobacteriota bacterium]MBP7812887.1 AbgT family transporter [Thermoanaerobaculia bacterium]MBP8844849.1 AbgT family transporter [Thermoanaerobaculia bacterium]HPA95830.1 AbgT family transporter [Thermoanaerobaculia bacterium]